MKIGDSTKNLSGEQGLSEEKTKSDKQLLTDDQLDSVAGGRFLCLPFTGAEGKGFARAEEKGTFSVIPEQAGAAGKAGKVTKKVIK